MKKDSIIKKIKKINKSQFLDEFENESLIIILEVYFSYLVKLIKENKNLTLIENNIKFIEELINCQDEKIINIIQISFYVDLFCELGFNNYLIKIVGNKFIIGYENAINDWLLTFNFKEIKIEIKQLELKLLEIINNNCALLIDKSYIFYIVDLKSFKVLNNYKIFYDIPDWREKFS